MKININDLRKIIHESVKSLLTEDKKAAEELDDSIDRQIDKYLSSYEEQSKPTKKESREFRNLTRDFLSVLSEADEKKEDEKKLTIEDLDVAVFADSVVRLIDNYDSLLEVKDTIAKRAIKFLEKNYEPDVADKFKIVLEDEYDIYVGKTPLSDLEKYPAPPADRANGSGGGASA